MMSIEDLYLKRLADFEFPGEPQPEEPMQMAQAPAQTMTDAQPDTGSIREIPRNMFQQAPGKFGEALTAAGVQLDKVGLDIPALALPELPSPSLPGLSLSVEFRTIQIPGLGLTLPSLSHPTLEIPGIPGLNLSLELPSLSPPSLGLGLPSLSLPEFSLPTCPLD